VSSGKPPASPGPGKRDKPAGLSTRWWVLVFLGSLPQILLSVLLLFQAREVAGDNDKMQSQLGLLAAAVFLFWTLVGCGVLAFWSRTRSLAGALTWGSCAGFLLTVVVALAT
jgi:hypothetical protein